MTFLRTIAPTRIFDSIRMVLGNLKGVFIGGIIGFFIAKQYETGLLFQRQMSRAFTIIGMEGEVILRLIFFTLLFLLLGAWIENKLKGGR